MWLQGTSSVYNGNFSHTPRAVLLQRQFCTILHQRFSYLQKSNLAIDKNGRLWQLWIVLFEMGVPCVGVLTYANTTCGLTSDRKMWIPTTISYLYICVISIHLLCIPIAIVMSTPTISYNELMWIPESLFDFIHIGLQVGSPPDHPTSWPDVPHSPPRSASEAGPTDQATNQAKHIGTNNSSDIMANNPILLWFIVVFQRNWRVRQNWV